jgi:hypothetical protein
MKKKSDKPSKAYAFCIELVIKAAQRAVKKPDDEAYQDKVLDKIGTLVPKMSESERQVIAKLISGL